MSDWYKDLVIDGKLYRIKKANDQKHKYVAWLASKIDEERTFLSRPVKFGAFGMPQYKDKFEQFKHLDHNDSKRLFAFRSRFAKVYEKNKNNPTSAIYWSWNYLW
jgi:hypothetical protein